MGVFIGLDVSRDGFGIDSGSAARTLDGDTPITEGIVTP
jgi:hypothetical protein